MIVKYDENVVKRFNGRRLSELEASKPNEVKAYREINGIPEEINSSGIILLEGRPVVLVSELKRVFDAIGGGSIEVVETSTMKCQDAGCVKRIFKGWKKSASGKAYKDFEEKEPLKTDVMWIAKVKITRQDEQFFVEEGDCCPHNCTSLTRSAMKRMAQTRAIGRALRLATSMSMTTFEEIDAQPLPHGSSPKEAVKKYDEARAISSSKEEKEENVAFEQLPEKEESKETTSSDALTLEAELELRKKRYKKCGVITKSLEKKGIDKNKARKVYYLILQSYFNAQSAKDVSLSDLDKFIDVYEKKAEEINPDNFEDVVKEISEKLVGEEEDVQMDSELSGEIRLD